MRRRLRKKLRLGEFREFGFELAFTLPSDLSDDQVLDFGDELFAEVESRNLMVGGASGHRWDVFVTRSRRGSATTEDREALRAWLEGQSLVSEVKVGELIDAWHAA